MKYSLITAKSCSPQLYQQLCSLCFRDKGMMRPAFRNAKRYDPEAIISYAEQDNKLISWALGFHRGKLDHFIVHTYTRKSYRKQGIAYKLIKQIEEYCIKNNKTIVYEPWDEQSHIFFTKCRAFSLVNVRFNYLAPSFERVMWRSYETRYDKVSSVFKSSDYEDDYE